MSMVEAQVQLQSRRGPRLAGKVAVITGGGSGLGRIIALAYAREGADVVLAARNEENLQETARLVTAFGRQALPVVTDVSREEDVVNMIAAARREFGRIDILVNNSGNGGPMAPITETDLAGFMDVLGVNLIGAFVATREALKDMVPRRQGAIINVGSIFGKRGYPLRVGYAAAKAALISLTQTTALEGGKHGIRCNCICPGPIQGDRIEKVWRLRAEVNGVPYEVIRDKMIRMAALRRIPEAEEVAEIAVYLASDEAAIITGQAINTDCGSEMR